MRTIQEGDGKTRAYISAPVTGYDLKKRMEYFRKVAEILRAFGYIAVNPLERVAQDLGLDKTHEEYMRRDLSLLLTCDIIFLAPGWNGSRGCRMEFEVAAETGIHIALLPAFVDARASSPDGWVRTNNN